jgi:hypothetical protein
MRTRVLVFPADLAQCSSLRVRSLFGEAQPRSGLIEAPIARRTPASIAKQAPRGLLEARRRDGHAAPDAVNASP